MANNSSSGGIGVCGLLGVAFVVLKLTGFITWSWWWVTLPFWGGLGVVAVILLSAGGIYGLTLFFKSSKKKKRIS